MRLNALGARIQPKSPQSISSAFGLVLAVSEAKGKGKRMTVSESIADNALGQGGNRLREMGRREW
jgi:hypothetical protein